LSVDPFPVVPVLAAPVLAVPVLAVPVLAVPVLAVPVLAVPVLAVPVLAVPVLADPGSTPPVAVSVGLVLAPPVPDEFDAGGAGVEERPPGVGDTVAPGLAAFDGGVVLAGQGVAVAVPSFALALAVAEAVEVAVLVAVALADPVPVAVTVGVAVVVSLGPVLSVTVPPFDPLSVALLGALLVGGTLGATDLVDSAGLAAKDDGEPDVHPVGGLLLWVAEVPPWPVPPAPELYWVPAPLTLGTPLPVLELEIPTAEASWPKASRSGGTASATPMANTTHAAARAGRSSPYRQSRCCRA
jgi:hypothetical protein